MKHNWNEIYWGLRSIMQTRIRICRNPGCLAIQEHTTNYEWMRVVGYTWNPKAGRCGSGLAAESWKTLQVDEKTKQRILREMQRSRRGV